MARSDLPAPQLTLTPDEARLLTLRAQGLMGADSRRGGVTAMLRRLGGVQLDTISVLARSHELVAYARLGPVGRERVERAYWNPRQPGAFEYWSHAACVLPIEEWPYYGFRRRALLARGQRWHQSHPDVCAAVLARIRAEGPLTATELGGAKKGGPWWDWSDTKIAVEWLLDTGEVACVRRTGWRPPRAGLWAWPPRPTWSTTSGCAGAARASRRTVRCWRRTRRRPRPGWSPCTSRPAGPAAPRWPPGPTPRPWPAR